MPLTHVCMWSKHGWTPVTLEEAKNIHPGGTTSAKSGLFMCSLCGQYVTFTKQGACDRHFRHSKKELSKDCPDRSFSSTSITSFIAGQHEMPIRLVLHSPDNFELEVGLLPIPDSSQFNRKNQLQITPCQTDVLPFAYSFSRLSRDTVTYFSVGNVPAPTYRITTSPPISVWPNVITGINENGTLFDGVTRKKLPVDADTEVNHTYLILTKRVIHSIYSGIVIENICRKRVGWNNWNIYRVKATRFDESAARFFLDFHCRLSENPVLLFPIWPATMQTPYFIYFCRNDIVLYLQGQAKAQVFPNAYLKTYNCLDGQVLKLDCNGRQQLLSAGRTKVLRYTYLWKDKLDNYSEPPSVSVVDFSGNKLTGGVSTILPQKSYMAIESTFDGFVTVEKEHKLLDRRELKAGEKTEISGIQFEYQIRVFQGLDCVWTAFFQRKKKEKKANNEDLILTQLKNSKGKLIPISHTLGANAAILNDYPFIKQWLYQKIREQSMSDRSYRIFKNFIRELKSSGIRG